MPGIERNRVVDRDEGTLDAMTCGICHHIIYDPIGTQCCQQTYCTLCMNQWLVDNNTCPKDSHTLDIQGLQPPLICFINMWNKLRIKCSNHNSGCEVIATIDDMKDHELNCDKSCSSCRNVKETIKLKEEENKTLQAKLKKMENDLDTSNKLNELKEKTHLSKLGKVESDLELVNKKFDDFKLASQERSVEQIILDARSFLNTYYIKECNLDERDVQSLIANCQNVINCSTDLADLAKRISDKMTDRNCNWTVIAESSEGTTSNFGFYVRYCKLAIINFGNLITIRAYQDD